jgi:hypothetical protein
MPEDKNLRTVRDRFNALKTQLALREAVLDVPTITVFDVERIIDQLWKHKDEFKHIAGFKECRAAFVAWAVRLAQLTVQLRKILPTLAVSDHISTLVLFRLPDYRGAEDDLEEWVVETAASQRKALEELGEWINRNRNAVYSGARIVLRTCKGLDKNLDDVADCIASDVWKFVADNALDFANSSDSELRARLKGLAESRARTWKSNRLDEIEAGDRVRESNTHSIGLHGLEATVRHPNGTSETVDVPCVSLNDLHNPIIIRDLPWTQADLERELRRAGPFRADGCDVELLPLAA